MSQEKPRKKIIKVGDVISDKMEKTVVVRVMRVLQHPTLRKVIKRFTKLYAHDEKNEARVGDRVVIMGTRPLSKLKRWRVIEVIKQPVSLEKESGI